VKANAGMEGAVKDELVSLVLQTRYEPGCLNYDVYQGTDDPSLFVLQGRWKDPKAIDEHLAMSFFAKDNNLLTEPIDVTTMVSPLRDITLKDSALEEPIPVMAVSWMKAKEGIEETVREELLFQVMQTHSQEPHAISFDLYQGSTRDFTTSSIFIVYEQWQSQADLEAHMAMPYTQDFMEKADNLAAEPIEHTFCEMVSLPMITVISRAKAKAGMEETAKQELLSFVRQTRHEPGCIGYDLYQSTQDLLQQVETNSYFVFYEKWRDVNAIGEHLATPYFADLMAKSENLFEGPFEVTKMISNPINVPDANTLTVILCIQAKEGLVETIKQGVAEMMVMMRAQPGSVNYDAYQGVDGIYDTSVFITYQNWADMESLQSAGGYLAQNMPFSLDDLAKPREPIVFQMISEP
jgi:quinol monooxygenase YgiN